MSLAMQITLVVLEFAVILQIKSLSMSIGILKAECEVRPPSNKSVAIPEEAIAMATFPSQRTAARRTL
jgi:hypothetical protein